ncbi:MAG TPA: heme ABC exporter ATP-binding protein CcmA [Terriglobia bacterium]|nr:heme ABC exporter ATP-binding protein CcmA [Terriglobia bacterium]
MPSDTPPTKPALELRNVSKQFGIFQALSGVCLRIEPGDSILLYGPNGAGKTTLLRVLSTLARPSEGTVLYAGADVLAHPAAAKAAIGFVSHTTFLYGELTARENLEFVGKLFALTNLRGRMAIVLDLFHLRERAETPVRELSRGYQQRVSLARAFLHDPQFLLLDEPFTGLDAASTESLQGLMQHLQGQGKALIFSTHDFEQGKAIAQRLVALEGGKVRYDGPLNLAPRLGVRSQESGDRS